MINSVHDSVFVIINHYIQFVIGFYYMSFDARDKGSLGGDRLGLAWRGSPDKGQARAARDRNLSLE
jgi:hypothetical protein